MQITHEEARRLIQFNSDRILDAGKQNTLSGHLKDCAECRVYADELQEAEDIVRGVMGRQWKVSPFPFSMSVIIEKRNQMKKASHLLATRTAVISLVVMIFLFGVWQITLTDEETPGQSPLGAFPVPTPSTQLTSTKITMQDCEEAYYKVQEGDTLESMAYQFSTSKETIMTLNDLDTEVIEASTELIIPLCSITPTGTIYPATSTITLTPTNGFTAHTPGG
jgi:hypothetical protein